MKNFDHSQSSDAFRVPLTNIYKAMDAEKNLKTKNRVNARAERRNGKFRPLQPLRKGELS